MAPRTSAPEPDPDPDLDSDSDSGSGSDGCSGADARLDGLGYGRSAGSGLDAGCCEGKRIGLAVGSWSWPSGAR